MNRHFTLYLLVAFISLFASIGARAQDVDSEVERAARDVGSPADNSDYHVFLKKAELSVDTRLFVQYRTESDVDGRRDRFSVDSARLNFKLASGKRLASVLKFDLADLVDDGVVAAGVKEAYVELRAFSWLRFQVGKFKKRFSELENTSRRRLPVVSRGASNDYIVDFLGYGDRDLGAMVFGRLIKKIDLDYYASINSGTNLKDGALRSDGFKDLNMGLRVVPAEWLSSGVSLSGKYIGNSELMSFSDEIIGADLVDDDFPAYVAMAGPAFRNGFIKEHKWMRGMHWMGAVDTSLNFRDVHFLLEGMLGQNWWYQYSPYIYAVTAMLSYRHYFSNPAWFSVQPVIMGEVLTVADDTWEWRGRMLEVRPGINVFFGDDLRLMVQGEFTWTKGKEAYFDEKPYKGFWPGEWPGDFSSARTFWIQLAYAN